MSHRLAAALALALCLAGTARAQSPNNPGNGPWVNDTMSRPFTGVVMLTPGVTTATPGRSIAMVITTGGTATFTLVDPTTQAISTITLTLAASPQLQTLPFSVQRVDLGTAAGTFWSLL